LSPVTWNTSWASWRTAWRAVVVLVDPVPKPISRTRPLHPLHIGRHRVGRADLPEHSQHLLVRPAVQRAVERGDRGGGGGYGSTGSCRPPASRWSSSSARGRRAGSAARPGRAPGPDRWYLGSDIFHIHVEEVAGEAEVRCPGTRTGARECGRRARRSSGIFAISRAICSGGCAGRRTPWPRVESGQCAEGAPRMPIGCASWWESVMNFSHVLVHERVREDDVVNSSIATPSAARR